MRLYVAMLIITAGLLAAVPNASAKHCFDEPEIWLQIDCIYFELRDHVLKDIREGLPTAQDPCIEFEQPIQTQCQGSQFEIPN